MTRRVFTPEQDKEVARLYLAGLSSIKIAKQYQVDKSSVLGALQRQNVTRRIRKAKPKDPTDKRFTFRPSEEAQIVKIYQAGYNLRDIARVYECKSGTIRKILDRHNVITRETEYKETIKRRDKEISRLYNEGQTIDELTRIQGLSMAVIHKSLVRDGTPRRPIRKDFFNEQVFDCLDNEHSLYWMGFIYADSYLSHYELKIGLSVKDLDHLKKLVKFMNSSTGVKYDHRACFATFASLHMANTLKSLGLVSRRGQFDKLKDKIPAGLEHHFIRGYLDGDGCISNREKVIILGQSDILLWIKECLVKYAQASDKVMPYQRKGIMEIAWGGSFQFARVVDYIYKDATIYLERKKEIADKTKRG